MTGDLSPARRQRRNPSVGHRPRLLAIDVDGTMLRSNGTLSDRVLGAMQKAVNAGIHVVPSTGRPEVIAADVVEATGLDQYWVFGNGAVTRHLGRDELIRGFWIDRDVALRLITSLRSELPGVRFAVEFSAGLAYESGFEDVVPNQPDRPPSDDLVAEIAGHDGLVQKVLVFDSTIELAELFGQVSAHGAGQVFPTYSGLNFIELAAQDVTKATALRLLADDLDIDADRVWAVGDNHNDIEMLRWAGVGFAMGNAYEEVKSIADMVLPSNDEDGVAVLIEDLIG